VFAGWQQRWLTVVLLTILTGCATDVRIMVSDLEKQQTDVELIQTPFYPQVTDQCGPSALASVLNFSGIAVTPEALKSRIYIPDRQGSLQLEMLAATRRYGRIPYLIDQDVGVLLGELRSGRPVANSCPYGIMQW
jgi:hypothetical protein